MFPRLPQKQRTAQPVLRRVPPVQRVLAPEPEPDFEVESEPEPEMMEAEQQEEVQEQEEEQEEELYETSPAAPEKMRLPPVAQKQNFTPRPHARQAQMFPSSARAGVPTPPRMQLSHADIQRWQRDTSNASPEDSAAADRRLLRPLPPKNASPSKSNLRSPMKPRTPGRVVEFASGVLSPLEQAKMRAQRRNAGAAPDEVATEPSSDEPTPQLVVPAMLQQQQQQQQPPPPPPRADDKENQAGTSEPSESASSPLAARSSKAQTAAAAQQQQQQQQKQQQRQEQQHQPLSQTTWSRRHWALLNNILQERKRGPFGRDFARRSERLLGKKVKSQGAAMVLERWHLDCVDAFAALVGGWDEGALAKRLFGLIVGEERRRRRAEEAEARSYMFH